MKKAVVYTFASLLVFSLYRRYSNKIPVYYVDKLTGGFNGRTIPPFGIYILKSQKGNSNILEHEKIHWKQFKNLGLFGFYSRYMLETFKNVYDLNKLEIEARNIESEYCKKNYTTCVRSGKAKTIYNPNFRA